MIIIFNGPPGSGKDKCCEHIEEKGFIHLSFKKMLFDKTIEYYGVDTGWFLDEYNNREIKERKENALSGFSRREAMIHVSENILKPEYGKDFFGIEAAKLLEDGLDYCFSDGGFAEEIRPVINKCGADNICIIQLTRDGCDFSSDSRKYINGNLIESFVLGKATTISKSHILPEEFSVKTYRVHNNGNIKELYGAIEQICEKERRGAGSYREPL